MIARDLWLFSGDSAEWAPVRTLTPRGLVAPIPRCVCVNAVDKGVSGRFGVKTTNEGLTARVGVPPALARGKKAVDKGVTVLDEGGNGGWAGGGGCGIRGGCGIKGEREWAVGGSCRNRMLAPEVRRRLERDIGASVGVDPSRYSG